LPAALTEYSNGLQFAPDDPALYFNRGLCYTQLEQYEQALQDFDQVIHLDEFFAGAYFNRAKVHALLEDYAAALADLNQALAQRPDDVNALYDRGVLYLLSQDNQKAIDDFDAIISLEPAHVDARYGRGFAYAASGAYDQAIADYNAVIELDPQNAIVYNELAWLYADTLETNLSQAINLAEKAIELAKAQSLDDATLAGFLDTLGWAYFKQGDTASAEATLLQAIELHPGQTILHEHLRQVREESQ
jgi:tetratricopeptide (TPR) repeat protein